MLTTADNLEVAEALYAHVDAQDDSVGYAAIGTLRSDLRAILAHPGARAMLIGIVREMASHDPGFKIGDGSVLSAVLQWIIAHPDQVAAIIAIIRAIFGL